MHRRRGQRHPLVHRIARVLTRAGVRGAHRLWRLAARLAPLPDRTLVEVVPGVLLRVAGHEHIGRMIYRGDYERAERSLLGPLVPAGGTAVDVGANIGLYTAWMAYLVGRSGRVLAFEPSPDCLASLRANVDRAGLPQVVVHPVALGADRGEADLVNPGGPGNAGQGTLRLDAPAGTPGVHVPVRRLDQYLGRDDTIDLLKLDVEGYEEQVLSGGSSLFERERVRFVLLELSPEFVDVGFVARFLETSGTAYHPFLIRLRRGLLRWHPEVVPLRLGEITQCTSQSSLLLARRDDTPALERFLPSPVVHGGWRRRLTSRSGRHPGTAA